MTPDKILRYCRKAHKALQQMDLPVQVAHGLQEGHHRLVAEAAEADKILRYCLAHLDGTVLVNSWGERCVFYNPDGKLKRAQAAVLGLLRGGGGHLKGLHRNNCPFSHLMGQGLAVGPVCW